MSHIAEMLYIMSETCLWEPEFPGMKRTGIPENFSDFNLGRRIQIWVTYDALSTTFPGVSLLLLHKHTTHTLEIVESPGNTCQGTFKINVIVLLPFLPSWLEHTGDIHTCRSWHNHSPLGLATTQAPLQEWNWKGKILNDLPIENRVAMKSPMKMTGLTSSCLGSTPAAAAAGASSSSCSSPAEAPGSSSAIFTSTIAAVLKSCITRFIGER